jgi:nucleoside-diphosphate-sugar epimerase
MNNWRTMSTTSAQKLWIKAANASSALFSPPPAPTTARTIGDFCTEETPLNPLTIYGTTKTNAEQHLLQSGNAICYRFATAFGVSPRMRLDLLINDFVYQAVKVRNLIIYERTFKRTFIHVIDMARSIMFAAEWRPHGR